jgi:hypothetical protein
MELDQRHYDMAERTRQLLTSPFGLLAMAAVSAAIVTAVMMRLMQ